MKIDLTLKLTETHPAFSLFKKSENEHIRLGHFATHLDLHLKSTVPLEYMHRRGVLIDVSHIEKKDIELVEIDLTSVRENDFVIFKTDMIKRHDYGSKEYFANHTQLSDAIIDALIAKKVSFIGIDAAGVRRGLEHGIADKRCESEKVYIIENLNNLDALQKHASQPFTVTTLWVEVPGQTGLPCRVIGEVND